MTAPVGVAWAPEPAHWSELKVGDVIEVGDRLAMFIGTATHDGRRWLKTTSNGVTADGHWAPDGDPDPLALVLRRRDALVGEVIAPGPR